MSIEMTSGVIVANMLEGMRFALGPTMAIRRDVLTTIGGFGVLARYCADDYVLGQKVFEHGYKVALSNHVIDHIVISRDFVPSLRHQLRWMRSTRFSRGLAHVGSGLTFAIPFGLLAAAGALLNSQPAWAAGLFGIAFLNRVALSLIAGWGVVRDPRALSYFWLYPLRDLIGFLLWCASFLGDTIVWRDQEYRLEPGGRMRRVDEHLPQPEQESESITVDNLA
jgi:ceramide glucosyltransferase